VRENHPDRHIAAGMPEELVVIANERLAAINAAYEIVARERGL
jgi:DnaJ like chaperone protein